MSVNAADNTLSMYAAGTPIIYPMPFRLGHRPWLSGLRGIAALLVIACHFQLIRSGTPGMDLFFVISGFLITCLLLEEWKSTGGIRLGRFHLRRFLRLTPVFAAVLAVCFIYEAGWRPHSLAAYRNAMIVSACYVSNLPEVIPVPTYTLLHTWSLALEQQFYLIWPMMLLALLKLGASRRQIAAIVIAGIAASAVTRLSIYQARLHETNLAAVFFRLSTGLDTRADSLLVGCLLGMAASWNWLPTSKSAGRVYGVLAIASLTGFVYLAVKQTVYYHHFYNGLFTVTALMAAAIVTRLLLAPSSWELRLLGCWPLVAVGEISYALYLVHFPIQCYFDLPLGWRYPGNTLLVASISFVVAVVVHLAIERPFLAIKGRFRPQGRVADRQREPRFAPEALPVPDRRAA